MRVAANRKERPDYSDNILIEMNCHNLQLIYKRSIQDKIDFLDVFNLEADDHFDNSLIAQGNKPTIK